MLHDCLDVINDQFKRLHPALEGGEYALTRSAICALDCNVLAEKLWRVMGSVGASRFSLRLLKHGKDMHPAAFLSCRVGDGLIDHVTVKEAVVRNVLGDGGTLVFNHVNERLAEMQIIQESLEAHLGCKCWLQCYITQSKTTAFAMHGDDHPFFVLQLQGYKKWIHDTCQSDPAFAEVTYGPGDVAFYPKQKRHDVHGMGQLSMHLTVAFEGFGGKSFDDLPHAARESGATQRIGSGLPYSIRPDLVGNNTAVRLSTRCLPYMQSKEKRVLIYIGNAVLRAPLDFAKVIEWMHPRRQTTSTDISTHFTIDTARALKFVRFGLSNGLLFSSLA